MSLAIDEVRGMVPRAELYRALARIDELKAELNEQRERMALWAGEDKRQTLMAFGFRRWSATLIAALVARKTQPFDALCYAFEMPRRYDADAEVDANNLLKTRVCLTRKAIVSLGGPSGAIVTHWGVGYSLSEEGRAWVETIMQGAKP